MAWKIKSFLIATVFTLFGGFVGFELAVIDSANYRIMIAEKTAEVMLLEQMLSHEIPRIDAQIMEVEKRFMKCNEVAAMMGVAIKYPYVVNTGMGGE